MSSNRDVDLVKANTHQEFVAIIQDLQQREGIDRIALARTELPLILSGCNSPLLALIPLKST